VAQFHSLQNLFLVCSKTLAGSFYRETTMVMSEPFFSPAGLSCRCRKLMSIQQQNINFDFSVKKMLPPKKNVLGDNK